MNKNKQKELSEQKSVDVNDTDDKNSQAIGKKKKKIDDEGIANMSGIPIFKSGIWKEDLFFGIETLDEIVKNTNALITAGIIEPPVKLGHNEEQTLLQNDGYPAAGYVTKVYRLGNQIFADVKDMPKKIAELIEKRAYSKISAELYQSFKHPETQENLGYVLRAIAFLGADIPEVKGIGDITRLYNTENKITANVLSFAEDTNKFKEVSQMRTWTIKEVESVLPCCVDEVKKFMDENKKTELTVDEIAKIITEIKSAKMQEEKEEIEEKIECPEGYKWDAIVGRCVKLQEQPNDNTSEQKICPKGWGWNEKAGKCVKKEIAKEGVNEISGEPKEIKEIKIAIPDELRIKEIEKDEAYEKWEFEDIEGFPWPEHKKPPKDWWDECVAKVSGKTATPEKLCGWVWYHGTKPTTKKEISATETQAQTQTQAQTETETKTNEAINNAEKEAKVIELKEKIKELEQEKIKNKINELKERNRGILLPKFDEYINKFAELFINDEKVLKFNDSDISAIDLFLKFLNEIVNSKTVIFNELAKSNKQDDIDVEIDDKERQEFTENLSDVVNGRSVSNIDIAILAKKIADTKKLSMRDAVIEATKKILGKNK